VPGGFAIRVSLSVCLGNGIAAPVRFPLLRSEREGGRPAPGQPYRRV